MNRSVLILLGALAASACADAGTNPETDSPSLAKNSPRAVTLSEWQGRLWSPAGNVPGEFSTDGRLFSNTETSKRGPNAAPGIELCLNLSQLGGAGIVDQPLYDLFVHQVSRDPTSAGLSSACTVVTMHTRDHSNAEQMSGQAVGSIEHSGGKIVLKDYDTGVGGNGGWEWRLIWDGPGASLVDPPSPDLGQGVCIDHPDAPTWHVYNDDGLPGEPVGACAARGIAVDNIAELWRVTGDGFFHVAEFVFPFRFTVTQP